MTKKLLTLTFLFICFTATAQKYVVKPSYVKNTMDSTTTAQFNKSLNGFYAQVEKGKLTDKWLTPKNADFTKSLFEELEKYEKGKNKVRSKVWDKQLINIYPISKNKYFLAIAYTYNSSSYPVLLYKIDLVATKTGDEFTFSVPLDYLTRYWKTKKVGNITYHFRGKLNKKTAKRFNKKNTSIAKKLGVQPEKLDFYMTDDFQEISTLLGFRYSAYTNGKYRDGYGVDTKTIFAIDGNEDFSHDLFHYYSGKTNKHDDRNWITEEGAAYLWGNAYYTDKNGEMVTMKRLDAALKKYLIENPNANLFELFKNNAKIFPQIAPEISVRSTMAALIVNKVEKEKGMTGVLKLINAGHKDKLENFLKATNKLLGLNESNFNSRVRKLIEEY